MGGLRSHVPHGTANKKKLALLRLSPWVTRLGLSIPRPVEMAPPCRDGQEGWVLGQGCPKEAQPPGWLPRAFYPPALTRSTPPPRFSLLGSLLQWAPVLLGVLGAKEEHKVSSMGESIF